MAWSLIIFFSTEGLSEDYCEWSLDHVRVIEGHLSPSWKRGVDWKEGI